MRGLVCVWECIVRVPMGGPSPSSLGPSGKKKAKKCKFGLTEDDPETFRHIAQFRASATWAERSQHSSKGIFLAIDSVSAVYAAEAGLGFAFVCRAQPSPATSSSRPPLLSMFHRFADYVHMTVAKHNQLGDVFLHPARPYIYKTQKGKDRLQSRTPHNHMHAFRT